MPPALVRVAPAGAEPLLTRTPGHAPAMPTNLYTSPVCLRDILAQSYKFTVPAYQRPYSWRMLQAEQMFEDLIDALDHESDDQGSEPYFFGTLLMVARNT